MILSFAVLLPSCALFEKPHEFIQDSETRRQLAALETWRMEGRVGVRQVDESWQAALVWDHFRDFDHLTLSGPLGQGALDIEYSESHIRVTSADGKIEESSNPQELLESIIGIAVPLAALRYWVLGLAFPTVIFDSKYDSIGKLIQLSQLGWLCQYQDYQSVLHFSVPKKLSVINDRTRLKLVIDEWRLSDHDD
ncbi:MAG: lipoprotein insertase outer membrane protein LolB [Methylococcales bacterium]